MAGICNVEVNNTAGQYFRAGITFTSKAFFINYDRSGIPVTKAAVRQVQYNDAVYCVLSLYFDPAQMTQSVLNGIQMRLTCLNATPLLGNISRAQAGSNFNYSGSYLVSVQVGDLSYMNNAALPVPLSVINADTITATNGTITNLTSDTLVANLGIASENIQVDRIEPLHEDHTNLSSNKRPTWNGSELGLKSDFESSITQAGQVDVASDEISASFPADNDIMSSHRKEGAIGLNTSSNTLWQWLWSSDGSYMTSIAYPASAGDETIYVASVTGLNVGDILTIQGEEIVHGVKTISTVPDSAHGNGYAITFDTQGLQTAQSISNLVVRSTGQWSLYANYTSPYTSLLTTD
jgi:hypothetical protein